MARMSWSTLEGVGDQSEYDIHPQITCCSSENVIWDEIVLFACFMFRYHPICFCQQLYWKVSFLCVKVDDDVCGLVELYAVTSTGSVRYSRAACPSFPAFCPSFIFNSFWIRWVASGLDEYVHDVRRSLLSHTFNWQLWGAPMFCSIVSINLNQCLPGFSVLSVLYKDRFGNRHWYGQAPCWILQLAASFAPRFYSNIFKCKRISETGAQQVNERMVEVWLKVNDFVLYQYSNNQ